VIEFVETDSGEMAYGKPVYMYRFPNMTAPDGSNRTFDNNPAVTIPQNFNMGYDGAMLDGGAAVSYPEGFDSTFVSCINCPDRHRDHIFLPFLTLCIYNYR
jgi:hypothetical protein